MLRFELTTEILGRTRFAYSPLAEVAGALRLLGAGPVPHPYGPWARRTRPLLRDLDLLHAVCPPGKWSPGFLFWPTCGPATTLEDQLAEFVDTPADGLAADLELIWAGREMPTVARRMLADGRTGLARLAADLTTFWEVAIGPWWPRVWAVLEADVAHHASRLLAEGLYGLFADLHPDVRAVDGVLEVDKPEHPDATYPVEALTLIPSVFGHPRVVAGHDAGRVTLTYGARGVARVWVEQPAAPEEDRLGALLGRTRAAILRRLASPASTTQLARELDQSPGTVSQHLGVLRDNGLVSSWRAGRHVLYHQTGLGATVAAATAETGSSHAG